MRTLLTCAVFAAMTAQASAHAMLDHASPGAGAALGASPKMVVLDFSEALEPALSGATVIDAANHDVTASPAAVSGEEMKVALKLLVPGAYRVAWHAVSTDTHRTEGSYRFTVRK